MSDFVIIPTSFEFPSTGNPPILYLIMSSIADFTSLSLLIVTGFAVMISVALNGNR